MATPILRFFFCFAGPGSELPEGPAPSLTAPGGTTGAAEELGDAEAAWRGTGAVETVRDGGRAQGTCLDSGWSMEAVVPALQGRGPGVELSNRPETCPPAF